MGKFRLALCAFAGGALASSVAVATPVGVALVEDVSGNSAGVEFMDYVERGKVIQLGPRDTIVLNYMSSCVRETITGGTVTVGTDRSEVQTGKIERNTVPCDTGKMLLAADQAAQFGGRIVRGAPSGRDAADANPQFVLYGRSPIVELKAPGKLTIERIDQAGERKVVDIKAGNLVHGRFYDFAKRGPNLAAGGTYRASLGGQEVVFKIDPQAKPGHTPILGRLLRFVGSAT
jgi:hypothetical protein